MSELGWWAISGEALLAMLKRVQLGEDPWLVYMEEYVNSHVDNVPGRGDGAEPGDGHV